MRLASPRDGLLLVVFTESKNDFVEMTLEKYANVILNQHQKNISSASVKARRKLQIDGKNALQIETERSIENVWVRYLLTFTETSNHYHYIVTWARRSRFPVYRVNINKIILSFREKIPASRMQQHKHRPSASD